jgi:hypothetical protein
MNWAGNNALPGFIGKQSVYALRAITFRHKRLIRCDALIITSAKVGD